MRRTRRPNDDRRPERRGARGVRRGEGRGPDAAAAAAADRRTADVGRAQGKRHGALRFSERRPLGRGRRH